LTATARFTHVDPFEDTESWPMRYQPWRLIGFTHVDPFEDTESAGFFLLHVHRCPRFTHVDPFEDTESY